MSKPRRVLFVTVGMTALNATNLGAHVEGAADLREEAAAFLGGTDPAPDFFQRVLEAHQAFWRSGLPVRENRFATSAEMASSWYFLRVQASERSMGPERDRIVLFEPGRDRIVLLASDTAQGKFCARVNESLMKEYLFSRPCTDSESTCMEVIKGLEAKEHGFACQIVDSIEEIWSRHTAAGETIVNITGGFKGTLPALTWRCERTENCSMFYTHDSMDRAETITFFKERPPQYAERPIII